MGQTAAQEGPRMRVGLRRCAGSAMALLALATSAGPTRGQQATPAIADTIGLSERMIGPIHYTYSGSTRNALGFFGLDSDFEALVARDAAAYIETKRAVTYLHLGAAGTVLGGLALGSLFVEANSTNVGLLAGSTALVLFSRVKAGTHIQRGVDVFNRNARGVGDGSARPVQRASFHIGVHSERTHGTIWRLSIHVPFAAQSGAHH
jgi:hypothetical protein